MKNLVDIAKEHGVEESCLKAIQSLLDIDNKTKRLTNIQALLAWDQEVCMPKCGVDNRCNQMCLLEHLIHEEEIDSSIPEILNELGVSDTHPKGDTALPEKIGLWLRAKYKQWKQASSLPPALLHEIVRLQVESHHIWVEAREQNNFALFAPYLKKTIALQKEKADCLGYEESRYDALLHTFEDGLTASTTTKIFKKLQEHIIPLYQKAVEHSKQCPFTLGKVYMTKKEQMAFSHEIMAFTGYTEKIGRLDTSAHPFSSTVGKKDSRITTKIMEDCPLSNVFSLLHEMGHAFYDLGVDEIYRDTVCDDGASFGIHESQSRFLENAIGKNHALWEYLYPKLQNITNAFEGEPLDVFMHRILHVKPNLIRIESDEIGYALHIILRFEIEKELIEDNLSVNDIPEIWNKKMETYLGICPPNDREGVLQDVHWSEGYFGYFPTYQLGNLYAANLTEKLEHDMPNYTDFLREGNYTPIKEWQKETVHRHGASYTPSELLSLSVDSTMKFLEQRYLCI